MKKNSAGLLVAGIVTGLLIGSPTAQAAVEYLKALPATSAIYVDGQQVQIEAYTINGANYVKLRDVGEAVGFNVYWQDGVQIDTDDPYTGEAPTESVSSQNAEAIADEIISRTNSLRRQHGLAKLNTNTMLTKAAQVRAEEMALTSIYSHTRPDGNAFYTVTDCPYMAENIHRIADWTLETVRMDTAELAMKDWSSSPSHQRNLLNDRVTEIGVGLARGTNHDGMDCWYIAQLFRYPGQPITWVDQPLQ